MRGNLEVLTLLKHFQEIAEADPMYSHIAISMVKEPNTGLAQFEGPVALEHLQQESVQRMLGDLNTSIKNRMMPPADPDLPANYVRYNVAWGPHSFDFLVWLVDHEMMRIAEAAPAPLRVAFWSGLKTNIVNDEKVQLWLNNVFRPCLKLIGAVEDSMAMLGRHKSVYLPCDIVANARAGVEVPRLRTPAKINPGVGRGNYVTITLREAQRWPHRNSNPVAWFKFAQHLKARGEHVVFVRDTAHAAEPMPEFRTCPQASRDLLIRQALYESARCNFFVSNGPGTLAWFSDYPWIQFIEMFEEGHPYWCNTPTFWKKDMGLAPGEQWPWSRADQRIVWAPDTLENLVAAWEEHGQQLEQQVAVNEAKHHRAPPPSGPQSDLVPIIT